MKSIIVATFTFLLSFSVWAGEMDEFLKQLDLKPLEAKVLKNPDLKAQAALIFTLLAHTSEVKIHQMNGAIGNKVYLHKDGHKEAVYDSSGDLVKDCLNMGSYNYYHPYQQPIAHFSADILPWLIHGNCRNDPSTRKQRVYAYMSDLRLGMDRLVGGNQGFSLPASFNFQDDKQSVAITFYFRALSAAEFGFKDMSPKNINNKARQEAFFKALESGFNRLLKNI